MYLLIDTVTHVVYLLFCVVPVLLSLLLFFWLWLLWLFVIQMISHDFDFNFDIRNANSSYNWSRQPNILAVRIEDTPSFLQVFLKYALLVLNNVYNQQAIHDRIDSLVALLTNEVSVSDWV